ncbi:AAEL012085-PA [Aedes aegypti]|uniref:AAEL012085-PA n=1 Tax=Aedes aegypti TaxID=7159 RepID=Q16N49_AEDAE|nr:AAEL012085-PA [Aedes aegypti]
MREWLKISLMLCTFGFFREMRPSEPFVTEFLSGEWRDIEPEQLNRDVYPIGTYSYLGLLVVVFLVTDILRYKSIIIFSACVGIVIWSLLLWTSTLAALQCNRGQISAGGQFWINFRHKYVRGVGLPVHPDCGGHFRVGPDADATWPVQSLRRLLPGPGCGISRAGNCQQREAL